MARKRDIGTEILEGIREIKQGVIGRVVTFSPITETRALDPKVLPLDPVLRRAVSADANNARDAWGVLGMMANYDRPEAGVFLLGLMRVHGDDLVRMAVLVRAVSSFPSRAAAEALKGEFYRVASTPATRTYLNEVLRSLTQLPSHLSCEALETLACDNNLSGKWRRRFEEAARRQNS